MTKRSLGKAYPRRVIDFNWFFVSETATTTTTTAAAAAVAAAVADVQRYLTVPCPAKDTS
jgi:hypothetical protein